MRADLPPLPAKMQSLLEDARGFPVPWFVKWEAGKPVFEAADSDKWVRAVRGKLCWLCGQPLGAYCAFVIGPMCAVNRVSSEPASHRECAEFALKACPFLTRPAAKRTSHKLPEHLRHKPAGFMVERNPGVALLWVTKIWKTFRAEGGYLISVGPPAHLAFYREARPATKAEVMESVSAGLPILQEVAEKNGEIAMRELGRQVAIFSQLLNATFEREAPANG